MDLATYPRMEVTPRIRARYRAYLESSEWRKRRNAALKNAGFRCDRCRGKRDLQVHHRTYERLGAELPADLEVLCENCHREHHLASPPESIRLFLSLAKEALTADPWANYSDLCEDVKRRCAQLKIRYHGERVSSAVMLLIRKRADPPTERELKDAQAKGVDPFNRGLTDDESKSFLARLTAVADLPLHRLVKRMPDAERYTAQNRAMDMICGEILASLKRCEELERVIEEDKAADLNR